MVSAPIQEIQIYHWEPNHVWVIAYPVAGVWTTVARTQEAVHMLIAELGLNADIPVVDQPRR